MPPKKQKRNAERTRANLLSHAETLFVKKGFHDVTVDEIAGSARVNKRMIYVYFGNKRGIYDQVMSDIFAKVDAMDLSNIEQINDYRDRLEYLMRQYFYFLKDNPNFVRLLAWETLYADKESIKQLVSKAYRVLRFMVRLLEEGVSCGVIRQGVDVRYLAMSANSLFISFFGNRALSEETWQEEFSSEEKLSEVFRHITGLLFNGFLSPDLRTSLS